MASHCMLVLLLAFQLAAASRHQYEGHTVHVVFSNHLVSRQRRCGSKIAVIGIALSTQQNPLIAAAGCRVH